MKQIVLLLMMCFPTLLWGNEVVQNGISYSIDEEKETAEVIGYDQSSSYVTIPSTINVDGKVYSVVSIGKSAFDRSDKLLEVTIEDGVEEIKKYANRFDFVLGVQSCAPYNCGLITYNGKAYLNIIRNIKEPLLEASLYEVLRELDIHVTAESNTRKEK